MDSINSWINEEEVRKLAEDLTSRPIAVEEKSETSEVGTEVEGEVDFVLAERQGETAMKEIDEVSQEVKESRSSSLAAASAMAASVGLIGSSRDAKKSEEQVISVAVIDEDASEINSDPLCDHCIGTVPVNISNGVKASLSVVNTDKEHGIFSEVDKRLVDSVQAKGICVIDRDGNVLYSSMKNPHFVVFAVDTMMETALMQTQKDDFKNTRVRMTAGEFLEFVSVKTTEGILLVVISIEYILGCSKVKELADDILRITKPA